MTKYRIVVGMRATTLPPVSSSYPGHISQHSVRHLCAEQYIELLDCFWRDTVLLTEDSLGTVAELTDSNGAVVKAYAYAACSNLLESPGTDGFSH